MTPLSLPATKGPSTAMRKLLAKLIKQGILDAVMVPIAQPPHQALTYALVVKPELLTSAQPLLPAMPINAAALASVLGLRDPLRRIGVILKPCEERALVELVKLNQASLERLFPIVADCPGACEKNELERLAAGPHGLDGAVDALLADAHEASAPGPALRSGCALCDDFVPSPITDIKIKLLGRVDSIGIHLSERLGDQVKIVLEALDLKTDEDAQEKDDSRLEVIKALQTARGEFRHREFQTTARFAADPLALVEEIAACIRCGACQRACPLCFCRRCIFETPALEHEPAELLRFADRLGATRLPEDALLFHLTRLAHMGINCVACGACESACPQDIRLTRLFRHVGPQVRKPFDYEPGRSVEEPLPLSIFEQEELEPR